MTSKELILSMLEQQQGQAVSGEAMAAELGISRAAVWKAVADLRSEGYLIEAATRSGYRLSPSNDVLSAQGIRTHLRHADVEIHCHASVGSTNQVAKQLAIEGAPHATVVVAAQQTAGRGRNGRSFHSPAGTGLYLSILLRPKLTTMAAMRVTSAVAVAVCRAIERLVVVKAGIKWVNDILIDGKKVCGILTEGISGFESGRIESVVVGIGVNVRTPQESFPEDVRPIAASLLDGKPSDPLSRNQLAAAIVDEVLTIMAQLESMAFLEEYRRRSVVLGANVLVVQGPHSYEAVVERIDDDGSLVVRASDTVVHTLNSGEISLRPLSGGHW